MKKLLHIVATPRGEHSRTLQVSHAFLETFKEKHPGCEIDPFNLCTQHLPALTTETLEGKYELMSGKDLSKQSRQAWMDIESVIERFLSADGYLISTPMWNFGIPHYLKHYIDVIVQPKYLFQYTESGVEGLAKDRKMVVVTSRGGDYSAGSPSQPYDFQEPYLRTVFGFVGITDITFVNAQPMDAMGPDMAKEKLDAAMEEARKAAGSI